MLKAPEPDSHRRPQFVSPLEEQSEAIFSQLLEHGSNGAELIRNSDLRRTEVEIHSTLEETTVEHSSHRDPNTFVENLRNARFQNYSPMSTYA